MKKTLTNYEAVYQKGARHGVRYVLGLIFITVVLPAIYLLIYFMIWG
jgi:hypothetical protein